MHKTKTHLQRVLGDENVLVVKFAEEVADRRQPDISWDSYSMYNKIAREGIVVGFYRYRFFGEPFFNAVGEVNFQNFGLFLFYCSYFSLLFQLYYRSEAVKSGCVLDTFF